MDVPLNPGKTAFVINLITDVLAVIATFCFVGTLNAYGRWKLYQEGKVSMDMHFHDMSFAGAFLNLLRLRRSSTQVIILMLIHTILFAFLVALKLAAPIGVSESKNLSVQRNNTVPGESLCLKHGATNPSEVLGIAARKIIMPFNTGGKILRVGRTGQNLDALLVEDEEYSHGHAHLLKESFIEAKINVSSPRGNYKVDINAWDFLENTTGYPEDLTAHYSTIVRNATYLPTIQITEGPLYFVICIFGHGTENYMKCAFGKCAVPRVDLPYSRFRLVRGNCSVAFLERSTAKSGIFRGFEPEASSLRYLDLAFGHVDVSFLGQGSIMINDLAITLQSKPCGDTYVAYLPPSNISRTSVVIVCALGITALASCVAAIMSLFITRHTFNWNGSYQRVVSLAASSEQMRVFGRNDFAAVATADVVIEERPTHHGKGLCVRIVPTDATSNPVPKASRKLLQ